MSGIGNLNMPGVRHGANTTPFWVKNPFFAAPTNGIDLIVGQTQTIFGDALVNVPVPVPADYTVTYTCAIGTQSGNNLVLSPVIADVGDHALSILIKSGNTTIGTFSTNLKVTELEPVTALKVLLCGDSTVQNGIVDITTAITSTLVGTSVTYVGTQGTTVKHEGRGGWTWWNFSGTALSPFRKSGAINIPAYLADNSLATPDIVIFRLGLNDMFGQLSKGLSEAGINVEIAAIITLAKNLVDAWLALNSTIKVVIELCGICRNSTQGWNDAYDESIYNQNLFVEYIHRFWVANIAQFDNYNARVSVNATSLFLDRLNGYDAIQGLHFNAVGNTQMGVGLACKINKLIDNLYGAEIVPNGRFDSDIDWSKYSGTTISSGYCNVNEASGYGPVVGQIKQLSVGKTYRTKYSISDRTLGSIRIELGAWETTYNSGELMSENKVNKIQLIPYTDSSSEKLIKFRCWGGAILKLDNVSVREVL